MARRYIPERGDLIFTDFSPGASHEQAKHRPALVLSLKDFNRKMKLALMAPITSRVRTHGFEVLLEGSKIKGAILCHQIRMIDFRARKVRLVESCPTEVLADALAKVRTIVQ